MLKRIASIVLWILAGIIIVSIANDLLAYRVSRFASVEVGKYYEYSGVVDIHVMSSDGTYQSIERLCDSLGLHFAIFVDRNDTEVMKEKLAHRFGVTLMVPAVEILPNDQSSSLLTIGDSMPLLPDAQISADSVTRYALRKEDIVFLKLGSGSGTMTNADAGNGVKFSGIELYNFDSGLKSQRNVAGVNKIIAAYFVSTFQGEALDYLLQYPTEEMNAFDRLNMARKVVGIGSLGAGPSMKPGEREHSHFPRYEEMLELVHTIIVTRTSFNGLYQHDRDILVNAIRNGNMYIGFSGLEHARGFLFTARSDTSEVIMGDSIRLGKTTNLYISMPDSGDVTTQVVRNGEIIGTYTNASSITLPVTKSGEYRVQAFESRTMLPFFTKRWFPWILSNPIYVYE